MDRVPVPAAPIDTGGEAGVDTYRHFFYNTGWQILETRKTTTENDGPESLDPEYQYVWSARYIDAPILRDKNTDEDGLCDNERIYYTTDANMNVTALILEDEEDVWIVVERYAYDAYGHTLVFHGDWTSNHDGTAYENRILFAGYYRDPETWFYHVRNRIYQAELGRFMQRDPLGYADGMSLYEYVGSNPAQDTDPTGLVCCCTCPGGGIFRTVTVFWDAEGRIDMVSTTFRSQSTSTGVR